MLDVGYFLDYCGNQMLTNVRRMICANADEMLFKNYDDNEVYVLPMKAIKFIVPHIERCRTIEELNGAEDADWSD